MKEGDRVVENVSVVFCALRMLCRPYYRLRIILTNKPLLPRWRASSSSLVRCPGANVAKKRKVPVERNRSLSLLNIAQGTKIENVRIKQK